MKTILNLFWQICLLRQSPAHVPTQGWFVALVVLANLLCSVVISTTIDTGLDVLRTATGIVVGQTATAALIFLALTLSNRGTRFVTTITAVFGCDLIITACYALVMPAATLGGEAATNVALIMFLVWSVAVAGFILHRALEAPLAVGIGVAMAIALMSVTLGQLAIGPPAGT
jgi:hypothetical protein